MADSEASLLHLLCSRCGKKHVLQSRPKFCPECGKKIDDKNIEPFPQATEPSQSSSSDSKHLDSQGATLISDASKDGSSSGTSQLPSEGSGSASRGGQIVDTVTHPLGTDDQSSSSQPSGSQTYDQRRQGAHDQPHKATISPQDTYSHGGQDKRQDAHGHDDTHGLDQDVYDKDSSTHDQSSNTRGQDSCGRDRSASLTRDGIGNRSMQRNDDAHSPDNAGQGTKSKFEAKADSRKGEVAYIKNDNADETPKKSTRRSTSITTSRGIMKLKFDPPKFHEKSDDPYVLVEFHVLLSKEEWLWDDSSSAVYICFGHGFLGNFTWCYGPMEIVEESTDDEDVIELFHTVEIPLVAINRHPFCPYKYCVVSNVTNQVTKSPFEFIPGHTLPKEIINRSLKFIDSSYLNKGRIYKKFDGSMHPELDYDKLKQLQSQEESKPSLWKTLTGWVSKKIAGLTTSSGETNVKSFPVVKIFLSTYYDVLTGRKPFRGSPITIMNDIIYIFNSLFKGFYHYDVSHRYSCWNSHIKQEMCNWLLSIIDFYERQNNFDNFNILQNVMIFLMVINRLDLLQEMYLEDKHYRVLFKGLCTISKYKNTDVWPQFVSVQETFLIDYSVKSRFVDFLKKLQREASSLRTPVPEILFSFPVLNFVHGTWTPFKILSELPTLDSKIRAALAYFKQVTARCFPMPAKFLDDHPHLFVVDQLLLYFFVQVSPLEEYNNLIKRVPLFMILMGLLEKIPLDDKQKELDMVTLLLETGSNLNYSLETKKQLIAAVESALQLVVKGRQKYGTLNQQLCIMVELFLLLRERVNVATEDEEILSLMHNKWNLQGFIQELIQALLPQKEFGGSKHKHLEEIVIWTRLNEINCPNSFEVDWHTSIEKVIKERISKAKSQLKDILLSVDLETTPEFLVEIILTYVSTNYENIQDLEGSTLLQQILSSPTRYGHSIANRILNLLSEMLEKRYPRAADVTETELLDWKMWPSYLGMIVRSVKLRKEHHFAIVAALSQLGELCKSVFTQTITLDSLNNVKRKSLQLRKLCDAVSSSKQEQYFEYSELEPCLKECYRLQEMFENYQKRISVLIHFCSDISHGSLTQKLRSELYADSRDVQVKSLYETTTDESGVTQFACTYFSSKEIPNDLLQYLYIVGNKYRNDLFETCWRWRSKACSNLKSFVAVHEEICMPVLSECKEILITLQRNTMTLETVEKYFLKFELRDLQNDLSQLCQGIKECFPQDKLLPAKKWVSAAVKVIQEYRNINSYMVAAKVVLRLKESMKLSGDFSVIETIAEQMKPGFKKQALSVISKELVKAGEDLKNLSTIPGRCECLKSFSESADLVEWLKVETGNVGAVANFVEVATSTTGEGDYHLERLSMLHTVATGYSSLIFDVVPTTGFKELSIKCNSLWRALEENPELPAYLTQCKNDLDWYKEIKKIQGSVEVTSVNQVEDINKFGAYTISCKGKKILPSIEDAIVLEISRVKAAKRSYSFNDLRDLESKLVLIRGRSTKGGAEIDRFLDVFHLVCRIAKALYELQNAGHTKYISWSLTFTCSTASAEKLRNQAVEMENELSESLKSVHEHRQNFHGLNYFTTQQLLQIRRELGNYKQSKPRTQQLYSLLMSYSLNVTASDIERVVDEVCKLFSEQAANEQVEEESTETQLNVVTENKSFELTSAEEDREVSNVKSSNEEYSSKEKLSDLISQLSPEEEDVFEQLRALEFNNVICYKAVRHAFSSTEDDDERMDVAMGWCFDNSNLCDDNEVSSIPKTASGEEVNLPHQSTPDSNTSLSESYNVQHPVVQQLLDLGYSAELSIKATKLHHGDFEKASEWCLDDEAKHHDTEQTLFSSISEGVTTSFQQDEGDVVSTSDEWMESWDKESANEYMDLLETAAVLEQIHDQFPGLSSGRSFPEKILHVGEPNLLIVAAGNVLKTVLSLYMEDPQLPLPSSAEVFICTPTTTAEEVELLWHRATKDPDYKHIYCLVHAERLSYQVCETAFKEYDSICQGNNNYRVVIICSLEDEERAHVISKLHQYRREYPPLPSTTQIASYLKQHLINEDPSCAARVDPEMSSVRVVASDASGMGKSLYVEKLVQQLQRRRSKTDPHVIVPVHGPVVNTDIIMTSLCHHIPDYCAPPAQIIHLDIAPSVLSDIDTLLFSLLILKSLTNSKGHIWQCLPVQYYVVEVTYLNLKLKAKGQKTKELLPSTMSLLELLPTVNCLSPLKVFQRCKVPKTVSTEVLMDDGTFRSSRFQRVYQYLRRYYVAKNLSRFFFDPHTVEGDAHNALHLLLLYCGVKNPSWTELHHFIKFLNTQLEDCESSIFTNEAVVGDILQGFKQFVVQFMIRMSRDFATPSLKAAVMYAENEADDVEDGQQDVTERYQIVERKAWERSCHPYLFFNRDHDSVTFLGFKITPDGNLVDPMNNEAIERGLMTKELRNGLAQQRVNFDEDYNAWSKATMIEKLCFVMGIGYPSDPDDSYVLTIDNMKKMLAIHMRFRCNIPVVIMGETGCGKTRLIRYMCELQAFGTGYQNMLMMKVHGGITERDIEQKVKKVLELAKQNKKASPPVDTVLFFDEANTTDAIGLIKEIMCDRRLNGKPIPEDIKFIAACNPYRKHSKEMIKRLENAGLGFYVKSTKTIHKIGSIPLRQLVYRVLALPASMQPLVYDFGQLTDNTEEAYTVQIVKDRIRKNDHLKSHFNSQQIQNTVSHVLATSQLYMRKRRDECSFVSLRDVERAMIVFEWFVDKHEIIDEELKDLENKPLHPIVRSLVMAVAVCYHARLQDRREFEDFIVQRFVAPLSIPGGTKQFLDEIMKCQTMFLRQMKLGPNIASNAALRENVFMMVVCIELRIPLFLVGKPGSSKSLAKSIIADSMQGHTSHTKFLKELKQVKMFSYQCSQLSTPESVLEVFGTATKFQANKNKDTTRFVSVVVLDEVGLAEDSPSLPLKALHPLLEDGTSGADSNAQFVARENRVAFIGISNWALDPAKMNRGVMVTRGEPNKEELILSAKGICSVESDKYRDRLDTYFEPLAKSYLQICKKQYPKEFFGLRDFYSLIKMLYWMVKRTNQPLTMEQLVHAVKRNFGGLDDEVDAVGIFKENIHIASIKDTIDDPSLKEAMYPDCSAMGLIKTSLATKETSWHGESRYLLFLTENYAALRILQQDLLFNAENPPFVLFGSSFPKDMEYTQVCRNINQIKICMETGRNVILLNLENLYESLYDVLNQYYTLLPGKRYVDLGLQTHRIKCRVHDDFKLILIAEKDKVYDEFPTPLINRLEKHFVVTSTVLTENQKQLLEEVKAWANKYACVRNFKVGDAFVGYQDDTPAAVVFQVTHLLKNDESETSDEALARWKAKALALSKRLLLETASPDSLVRLKGLRNDQEFHNCVKIYFEEQYHSCLGDLLKAKLFDPLNPKEGLLLHVTTHSHLMSRVDTNLLYHSLGLRSNQVHCFLLQEFDTEMDFSNKIRPIFRRHTGEDCLLIIQCDAGHLNIDLIACARHRIIDERVSTLQMNIDTSHCVPLQATHVVFIVQLPKQVGGTKFVGFQGAQWYSVHIDDLSPPNDFSFTLPNAFYHSLSEIFGVNVTTNAIAESSPAGVPLFSASKRIHKLIQTAASRLQDNEENRQRTTGRIQLLIDLIPSEDADYDGETRFHHILIEHISSVLFKRDSDMPDAKDWAYIESVDSKKLRQGGTFRNCLSRKFDEVIVPIFAEILGSIDKNYNLSLIHNMKDDQSSLIAQLWLGIFSNKQVCPFTYDDVVAKSQKQQQNYRGKVPGIGTLLASPDYTCKFPFSWLVKDAIDTQWNNATASATQLGAPMYTQLYDLVSTTALGEFLNDEKFSSHPEECLELYNLYLFDFVKSVYRTTQECEVELVHQAVDSVVQKTRSSGNLLELLIAVHVAYDGVNAHIQQFQQLASMEPSIVDVLVKTVPYPAAEMNLAYFAVQEVLDILAPKFNQWDHHTVQNWIRKLHKISNVIDTVLSFETEPNTVAEELRIANRHKWQRMCVIKMFAEHISLKFTEDQIIISAKRLWAYLAKPNFQSKVTLMKIKKVIDSLDINVRKSQDTTQMEGQETPDEFQLIQRQTRFRHQCRSFFMEVISTLCFEPNMPNPPDRDLIMMLMDIVFAEGKSTRILSPFNNEQTDPAPVIRSYLLQLLLEFSSTNVQALLEEYFKRSQDLAQQDQDLYVLCVQCFEDSAFSRSSGKALLNNRVEFALEIIRRGHDIYQDSDGTITLEYLEAISYLRYGLSFAANCLSEYQHTSGDVETLQSPSEGIFGRLFDKIKHVCLNSYHGQPHEFMIKYIARQFGMQFLKKLIDHPTFNWLIPHHLQPAKQKSVTVDSYVLYGKSYKDVREAVALTLCGSDISELQTAVKEFTPSNSIVIPLALYQQVTVQAKKVPDEALKNLTTLVQNCAFLNNEMQFMTGLMMQRVHFARLQIDHENAHHLLLRDVVIHSAVMLTHKRREGILQPFIRLMSNPSTMRGTYLPTMPDDSLFHAMNVLVGSYYTCPKGHPYHIGDCGRAVVQARCPECGSTIGGLSHASAAGNNPVLNRGDATHTGHVLGPAVKRSVLPEPERSLPPSGCALLRLLLHAVLVWSSSNADGNNFAELASIVHPGIPNEYLVQFFWEHLQRDVDVLSKSLNLNKDDAILVVHIFLRHISQLQQFPGCDSSLSSKPLREQWEKQFYETCMLPVLQDTQKHLRKALHLIANDDSQEHDALFFTIYEKMPVHSGDIQPALWRYRTRITLEHLTHILQQNTGKGLKILKQFLHLEPVLRVTQYLPDILYLQKLLFDQFHQRFDQGKALEMSIKEYLMKLNNDHLRNTILKLTKSFDKAWVVARKHLLNYGRLRVSEEYITAMPTINEYTKLTYLIPTTTGEGICSTGLLDFLVVTHNTFIKYYHDHYPLSEKYKEDELMKNSIPLSQLQDCHLLNYESHIIPVVLNHCHHSLEVGKGTDIQYDLPALEKKIVDRFIHGKPLIQFENAPRVVYRKDTHDAEKFNDVRTKVQQEAMTAERRKMILAELRSPQKLSEVLDVIDVVLGFLASAGGNPSMSLGDYVKKILKMNRRVLPKIIQECTLANTLSLWEVLSVEQARQLTLINQDPFDQVDSAFKEQLSSDLLKRLQLALRRFPLDYLLSVLHEFIITHVSHVDLTEQQQHQWLLKDTMEGFLERQNLPEFQELEHFPDDLLMCHVTNTWKEIVLYQNQVEY